MGLVFSVLPDFDSGPVSESSSNEGNVGLSKMGSSLGITKGTKKRKIELH